MVSHLARSLARGEPDDPRFVLARVTREEKRARDYCGARAAPGAG